MGAGLLFLVLARLVTEAVKGWKRSAMSVWIGAGAAVVAFHGFFDLPFRCPAILYVWVILLAAHPLISERARLVRRLETAGLEGA